MKAQIKADGLIPAARPSVQQRLVSDVLRKLGELW